MRPEVKNIKSFRLSIWYTEWDEAGLAVAWGRGQGGI